MGEDCLQNEVSSSLSSARRTKQQKLHDVPSQDANSPTTWLVKDVAKTVVASSDESSDDDKKPAAVKKSSPDEDHNLYSESPPHDDDDDEVISSNQQKSNEFEACENNDDGRRNKSPILPFASSLEEYLVCGGHLKYAPRPEWFQFTKDTSEVDVASNMSMLLPISRLVSVLIRFATILKPLSHFS